MTAEGHYCHESRFLGVLVDGRAEGRGFFEVLHEVLDVVQVPAQESLLFVGGSRVTDHLATTAAGAVGVLRHWSGRELARAALQTRWAAAPAENGGLRHEVEVQELHQLQLDLARGATLLEERCDSEKTIEVLKGAGIGRAVQQRRDESEQGGRLDGRAVDRVEQVQQQIHIDLAREEGAGWWVQQQNTLDQIECADDEHVVGTVASAAKQVLEAGNEAQGHCRYQHVGWGLKIYIVKSLCTYRSIESHLGA